MERLLTCVRPKQLCVHRPLPPVAHQSFSEILVVARLRLKLSFSRAGVTRAIMLRGLLCGPLALAPAVECDTVCCSLGAHRLEMRCCVNSLQNVRPTARPWRMRTCAASSPPCSLS